RATAEVAEDREMPRGIPVVGSHRRLREGESALEERRARAVVALARCGVAQRKRLEGAERPRQVVRSHGRRLSQQEDGDHYRCRFEPHASFALRGAATVGPVPCTPTCTDARGQADLSRWPRALVTQSKCGTGAGTARWPVDRAPC